MDLDVCDDMPKLMTSLIKTLERHMLFSVLVFFVLELLLPPILWAGAALCFWVVCLSSYVHDYQVTGIL